MAGYADTRQMIIDTLMGRPAGTEIQPEDHQAFALQITDYIRSVELVAGNAAPIGFADASTVPVQPDNGQAVYLSSVGGAQTVVFSNFIDQSGNAISVTSTANVIKLVTLLWNGQYWSSQITSVNAVRDTTNGYLFMGVATPKINPGTPDQKVFYLATQAGEYANFGHTLPTNALTSLEWDGKRWLATHIADFATTDEMKQAIGVLANNALAGFSGFQMINEDDFNIIGEYVSKSGYITTNSNSSRTDYLPLNGRKIVCVDAYTNPGAGVVIAFFDANKKYISGISLDDGNSYKTYSGVAPDNACYVIFSNYDLTRRHMASIFASEESLSQRVDSTVYTYNAPLTADSTSYINTSDGLEPYLYASSAHGKSTWYVDIKGFSTLRFNGEGGSKSVASVAFYDENFTYLPNLTISAADATAGIVDFTEEKYNGVRYVRVSHYRYPVSSIDYSKFVAEFRTDVNIAQRLNILDGGQGLNVLVFGDSITDCANITITDGVTTSYTLKDPSVIIDLSNGKQQRWNRWPVILRNAMTCKEVRNYALSGATYKDVDGATTRKSLSYQVNLALADVDNAGGAFNQEHFNPDIIIFALGTNDSISNGTADSAFAKIVYNNDTADVEATLNALDRTKFCEAAMWSFLTIKNAFPYAQCFCYLPIQRNSNNNPIGSVHSELIKVANRFGVLIIDGGYSSGIVREISNYTLRDGFHPNWRGQNLMARQIISAIKSNYVSLDSSFMNKEQPTE